MLTASYSTHFNHMSELLTAKKEIPRHLVVKSTQCNNIMWIRRKLKLMKCAENCTESFIYAAKYPFRPAYYLFGVILTLILPRNITKYPFRPVYYLFGVILTLILPRNI